MKKILYLFIGIFALTIFMEPVRALGTNGSLVQVMDNEIHFFGTQNVVKCGTTEIPDLIPSITRTIVTLIKIAVPLVLIIMGMLDILKSVIASDEKKIAEGKTKFLKRMIPAALVFFVVTILQFLVNIVSPEATENEGNIWSCVDCMISDESKCGAVIERSNNTN